ncbi:hypothetical protein [Paractinoplanes rishiriensis]|uniref:hypothetical protein n=1 Tax=Paractinoplanes rishiriensis TaxID=1050105 RepID=UPI001940E4A0|nr:hypothetical protein [Actinoplanes rishiriensis]
MTPIGEPLEPGPHDRRPGAGLGDERKGPARAEPVPDRSVCRPLPGARFPRR